MKYQLYQLKIEQLVSYLNDAVIDLAPPFQRGRVWGPKLRRGLIQNILQGQPVPAIFLYKQPSGPKNLYVILDGKQRLESILLYIGDQREDLKVPAWKAYFSTEQEKRQAHFKCRVDGKLVNLAALPDEEIVKFRDYLLPIIEIDFDETANLGEMVQLFVDINLYGVKVKRFDIVKALYLNDPLLKQIFNLIAIKWDRPRDTIYKVKNNAYCRVLRKLDVVDHTEQPMNRVDIMWEKLFELALFAETGQHRKPVQILKEFIGHRGAVRHKKVSKSHIKLLARVFSFLSHAYRETRLDETRWATDQTHFYTLATSLIAQDSIIGVADSEIPGKLIEFDAIMSGTSENRYGMTAMRKVREYSTLSTRQTTDVGKRQRRQELFFEIMTLL